MKVRSIKSYVLQYDLDHELGYSQQYYRQRSAHLVRVETESGVVGWGECFGPGAVALANAHIVEDVIQPMVVGMSALDREVIWHRVYNLLRDHGRGGMPLQAQSGVDIALWDIAGKVTGLPLHQLLGGQFRESVPVYGYGMMLRRVDDLPQRFAAEAAGIAAAGFGAMKMKVGLGARQDIDLVGAVRDAIGPDVGLMVDANHAYTATEALQVGRALGDLGVGWFEEPVAPEDLDGYRHLRNQLDVPIAGGEASFTRWGWRDVLDAGCFDIAQPEVCALGGISEYQKVLALAHSKFVPVVNHVWGSAVAIATNLHLLTAMPDLPGRAHPASPMLEFDTTDNRFLDELLETRLDIRAQVAVDGHARPPVGPGLGVVPDEDVIAHYDVRS
ncbi:MAG: mandelate racemase/muconate lactonizing enzyme family protein [Actinomycetia bacterium]|nr:mandelate racemase/muconate lactonizing enzyme family protein [Actinomycetes bacterium]